MAVQNKKVKAKNNNQRYSLLDDLHQKLLEKIKVNSKGKVELKKSDLKLVLEEVFTNVSKEAVRGNKVRFPVIGSLMMKVVPARKAGKQKNPFTGEMVNVPARPESRKPKWSFPKTLKDFFADKKNWK